LITDSLLITLPIWMLRNLRITFVQKLGLSCLFALAASDIIIEIPRTVYSITYSSLQMTVVLSMLEASIAVMVCGLPMYRGLFGVAVQRSKASGSGSTGRRREKWYGYGSSGYGTSTTASGNPNRFSFIEGKIPGWGSKFSTKNEVYALPHYDGGDLFGSRSITMKREVAQESDHGEPDIEAGQGGRFVPADGRDSGSDIVIIQSPSPIAKTDS
jgi:hypothetical protein